MANSPGRSHPRRGAAWSRAPVFRSKSGKVVDGVEDEIVPLIGAEVSGDDLRPAADDHPVHVASYQNVAVPVGHRHRVVGGPVPHQGQGTDPARPLVAGVVRRGRQGQQGLQVPLHPLVR